VNNFFLTALALAPTAEKDLSDIQSFIFEKFHCPSALALPPVLPLFCAWATPQTELLKAIKKRGWKRFSFEGCFRLGGILCAQARPLSGAGFYLADCETAPGPPENIPPPPTYTVKTLRLVVMEMKTARSPFWWESVEWRTTFEDWIKLEPAGL
jgi:hypothetical protein